jgi:hypothetical protein
MHASRKQFVPIFCPLFLRVKIPAHESFDFGIA